ncbi:MAG: lipid-A-disaccharide synthase [Candidatus Omnitrophota bacterium]|nr:lipid-A-disaccharide synthase [Candidatus Omnitrophota bacterium]
MDKTIMIIAGEASGDLHGSSLASSLKAIDPDLRLIGMGGEKMIKAGVESYQNIEDLSVIGLGEVLSNLGKFTAVFRCLVGRLDSEKPDCVVLIDYPEFNLRFAKEAKKRNIPVIYYISPQIWAWRKGRVKIVKKFIEKMLVIFAFEKEFYEKEAVAAEFVGHPLLDVVRPRFSREEFLKLQGLADNKKILALLPGSRQIEVIRNLPVMLKAAGIIKNKLDDDIQFVIAKPKEIKGEIYAEILKDCRLKPKIIEDYPYDCVNAADLVLVASGTATLETAILEKPMLIIYKVSLLTWLVGKMLVKIPDIGLVNIVAGARIVPEFIQFDATAEKIADEAIGLISSPEKINKVKINLRAVKEKLGGPGASRRAAEIILDCFAPRLRDSQ